MCLNTHDDWNPNNPINQEENEPLTELEEQQLWNRELCDKIARLNNSISDAKIQLQFCIDMAEIGNNTLLLNNLKKIKL